MLNKSDCDIKSHSVFHDVLSQIPEDFRQVDSKKRISVLHVCRCLNMGEEILIPLYQRLEAKAITDIEEFSTILQIPVAVYRRDSDYRHRKIWFYKYAGDKLRG